MDASLVRKLLSQTEVLRAPQRALATFGSTRIEYHLVSPVEDLEGKTRLREGTVLSEKPKILTPESFSERFQGFGEEAKGFAEWITGAYRDLLRALEYNFRNQGFSTSVISESPAAVADRIRAELDSKEARDQALIRCPDGGWALALMKFSLDESARSFPTHVRDLERRGLFDPAAKEVSRRRREIERLFELAESDRDAAKALGKQLHDWGLFAEYEDRYLGLFR